MFLQQRCILDIINSSREYKYQDVTIFCKNGTFQASSLILSAIFPVINNALCSVFDKDRSCMISIPELETMELEILFQAIHQQSSTIKVGPILQELLEPSTKTEILNNTIDKDTESKDENVNLLELVDHIYNIANVEDDKNIAENLLVIPCESQQSAKSSTVFKLARSNVEQTKPEIDPLYIGLDRKELLYKDFEIKEEKRLRKHKFKKIHEDSKNFYRCIICEKTYDHRENLSSHMSNYHDERIFQCKECQKHCKGRKILLDHMKTHQTIKCNKCDESIRANSFSKHKLICSQTAPTNKCPYKNCDFIGYYPSDLEKHMNKHKSKQKFHDIIFY